MSALMIDLVLFAGFFLFAGAVVWIGTEIEIRKKGKK
jgi:hypothetical protein